MDQTPLDGRLTDLPGFSRLGDEGVDLLLADSTNAEVPGFLPSERDVGRVIADVITKATGRVIVACFASHVHRVQQVLDAATATDRHVALVGRSMVRNMQIARELGLLHVRDRALIDLAEAEELPSRRVVLVSTGSQGEPLSALSRMSNREHPTVRVVPDDTILLASSLIPGNENAVGRVINGLSRLGAKVVHRSTALVHVSGHAPAGELRFLINAVRPRNLMPVHGEWRHLRAHAAIARSTGLPDDRIMLAEDGTVVDLVAGRASVVGRIPVGYVYVDGLAVGDIGDSALKDRRILAEGVRTRRRRPAGRQGRLRPRSPPAGSPTTPMRSTPYEPSSSPRSSSRWRTAFATRTPSNTSSGAPSAAGSIRPTVADPCLCRRCSKSDPPMRERRLRTVQSWGAPTGRA
jgi:ribonuclease J